MNIACELEQSADRRPDHPVLIFDDGAQHWTFAELDLHASRVASGLEDAGVAPGERVAIVMGNRPEHVAAWYGIAKAGAVPVDINTILADEEWLFILEDCEPTAVVCGPEFVQRLEALVAKLSTPPTLWPLGATSSGRSYADLGPSSDRRPAVHRDAADLAVIAYTSGTTGFPKGVMHSHGLLLAQQASVEAINRFTEDDVIANLTPLFPMHGFLLQPAMAVHVGCSLVLSQRFDPAAFADASQRFAFSIGTFVPSIVIALLQLPEHAQPVFPSGRHFLVGGAPLHPEVKERFETAFGVPLLQGFGSTEVMKAIAMERADHRAPWGSCGQLWTGLEGRVRVVDDDGKDVAPSEVGEFVVHKSHATMGYWNRPDLTAEAFLDGDWFRMGDIGRIDDEGFVYLLDRKKDMIIRGGFNIYSAEIERVMNESPAVAEATVIGVPHERLGEVPKAYVVVRPGVEPSDDLVAQLRDDIRARIGSLKVPDQIEFVELDQLPRNAMGKVLKRTLRDGQKGVRTTTPVDEERLHDNSA